MQSQLQLSDIFEFLIGEEKKFVTRRIDPWISPDKEQNCIKWRWKWIFVKLLQNHSAGPKSVPNHFATPPECLESIFELMDAFWTTFLKSTSGRPEVTSAYTAQKLYFHELQNMLGESWKWAFWCRHDRGSKFIYSLEASPFQIFNIRLHFWKKNSKSQNHLHFLKDLCIKYA